MSDSARPFASSPTTSFAGPSVHVALDTTAMPARRAGAGVYTYHLARALAAALPPDATLTLFDRWHTFADLTSGQVRPVSVAARGRVRRLLWEQTRLPLELRRRGVDLFHGPHHALPVVSAGVRTVVTVHDVTFRLLPRRYPPMRRWYMHLITWLSARRANQIIVPSAAVARDFLARYGGAPARVTVVAEAPPPSMRVITDRAVLASVRRRLGLPERFILSVGTLEPGKNRPALLRALAMAGRQGMNHKLVIAGQQGWGTAAAGEMARRLGVEDAVHYTGYVADADLPALYNLADLFVFPSWREGFGLPPLEAMACGVPVIASDRPAMPEVLGDAALYAPPGRPDLLAEAMLLVLGDDLVADGLRERGLERAAGYTWARAARETLDVYRRVLSETGTNDRVPPAQTSL